MFFRATFVAVVVVGLLFIGWYFFVRGHRAIPLDASAGPTSETKTPIPASTKRIFKEPSFRFSFSIPDGFSAHEYPPDAKGDTIILLQNTQSDGMKIIISPLTEDMHTITADDLAPFVPKNPQSQVVADGYSALVFSAKDLSLQGGSRELWFPFHKNLYRLAAFETDPKLLDTVWKTWHFY